MANSVKLKRSSVASNSPTTSNLELGEVALNTYDGNLFFKKSPNGVEAIVQVATLDGTQTLTNKTLTGVTNTLTASLLKSATTEVSISAATAPVVGQVLTATAPDAATWQTPAAVSILGSIYRITKPATVELHAIHIVPTIHAKTVSYFQVDSTLTLDGDLYFLT